jgi:hypothetical protein
VDGVGRWFWQHWLPIATGVAGFAVGCVVGWARIGDGNVALGTLGEWIGGLGATLAVGWAVLAFRREREANERRFAEMVTVREDVTRRENPGLVWANVMVQNSGPAPIDRVVVSAELNDIPQWGAYHDQGSHEIGSGWRRNVRLIWVDASTEDPRIDRPTVVFLDAAEKWWRRTSGAPPERLAGPPEEAIAALTDTDAYRKYKIALFGDERGSVDAEPPTDP